MQLQGSRSQAPVFHSLTYRQHLQTQLTLKRRVLTEGVLHHHQGLHFLKDCNCSQT